MWQSYLFFLIHTNIFWNISVTIFKFYTCAYIYIYIYTVLMPVKCARQSQILYIWLPYFSFQIYDHKYSLFGSHFWFCEILWTTSKYHSQIFYIWQGYFFLSIYGNLSIPSLVDIFAFLINSQNFLSCTNLSVYTWCLCLWNTNWQLKIFYIWKKCMFLVTWCSWNTGPVACSLVA